jgi:hypothetical protein
MLYLAASERAANGGLVFQALFVDVRASAEILRERV